METINKFDRVYGGVIDVSLSTKPSTVKTVQPITGKTETFIIQTCRHEESGDYIFIEHIDESGVTRIAMPPKVANLIASQREALTKRRRSISSKAAMKARIDAGEVIGFRKKKA
jgi:ATP-dependent exoDNAse (exonuclease V) alpha subunit